MITINDFTLNNIKELKLPDINSDSIPSFINKIYSKKINFIKEKSQIENVPSLRQNNSEQEIELNFDFFQYIYICNYLIEFFNFEFEWNDFYLFNYVNDETENSVYFFNNNKLFCNVYTSNKLYISFKNDICFQIDKLVHPIVKDTKTLYFYGLYLLGLKEINLTNSFLQMFGPTVVSIFDEGIKNKDFYFCISNLILSQFPSFKEFFNLFLNFNQPQIKSEYLFVVRPPNRNLIQTINLESSIIENYWNGNKYIQDELKQDDIVFLNKLITIIKEEYDFLLNLVELNNQYFMFPLKEELYPIFTKLKLKTLKDSIRKLIFLHSILKSLYLFLIFSSYCIKNFSINNYSNYILLYLNINKVLFSIYKSVNYSKYMIQLGLINYNTSIFKELIGITEISSFNFNETLYSYYLSNTLNQIYTLKKKTNFKTSIENDIIQLINKIVFHHVDRQYYIQIIKILLNNDQINDYSFYMKLKHEKLKRFPNAKKAEKDDFDRGALRIKDLNSFQFFDLLPLTPIDEFMYLDFGGGLGSLTKSISTHLNLKKQNSFSADISFWFAQSHITEKYKDYITYRYLKTSILPFNDNTFDFITVFQTLHHIKNINKTISELYRIIKPNGVLLIREHNCENDTDRLLIDLEHSLYDIVVEENTDLSGFQSFNEHYFSKLELQTILSPFFTKITHNKVNTLINYPKDKGPTKYYYSAWKKILN